MSTRSYDASRRKAAAEQSQSRILAAARRQMVENGYAATTIPAIAEEAGVSPQSVYAVFGNKAGLLKRIVDVSIVGDEELVPVSGRPIVDEVRTARSGQARFQIFADFIAEVHGRLADILAIMNQAAGSDPQIAAMVDRGEAQRRQGMREFVDLMSEMRSLRPGMDLDEVTDIVWALTSATTYRALVRDRRWTAERYSGWLAETLAAATGRASK